MLIKQIRKQKGIKGYQLAERVGITGAYLSQIETGKKEPAIEVLRKISNELQIPLFTFFLEEPCNMENWDMIKSIIIKLIK